MSGYKVSGNFGRRAGQTYDIIPRMAVQTSPQTLLVQEMGNQTDGPAQHEQTVENTHAEVVLGLLRRESTTVADKVNEADSNAAIHVQNQVVLLRVVTVSTA